jgi:hypothetical protein
MGNFVIDVEAVGGHGCQRDKKDGEEVPGCGYDSCPDCTVRRFVADLKRKGNSVVRAKLTHWPGQPGSVEDNLLTGKRKGSF